MEQGKQGYGEHQEVTPMGATPYIMYDRSAQWVIQRFHEEQETFVATEWPSYTGLVGGWNNNSHRDCENREDEQW